MGMLMRNRKCYTGKIKDRNYVEMTRREEVLTMDNSGYVYLTRDANIPYTNDILGLNIKTTAGTQNMTVLPPYRQYNTNVTGSFWWIARVINTETMTGVAGTLTFQWYEVDNS